jgi:hypothetical protein
VFVPICETASSFLLRNTLLPESETVASPTKSIEKLQLLRLKKIKRLFGASFTWICRDARKLFGSGNHLRNHFFSSFDCRKFSNQRKTTFLREE